MVEIPDSLRCIFSTTLQQDENDTYYIEVPQSEIETGAVDPDTPYRVALLEQDQTHEQNGAQKNTNQSTSGRAPPSNSTQDPPVTEGETRVVEIESLGDQGDGIARVERGFVIVVPETKPDETVEIEIDNVKQNVAFGEVMETEPAKQPAV